jgi:hypothetical protein
VGFIRASYPDQSQQCIDNLSDGADWREELPAADGSSAGFHPSFDAVTGHVCCFPKGMLLTLLSCAVVLPGLAVMLVGLCNAPEGIQENGKFHYIWRNNRPEMSDVACIWTPLAEASAIDCAHTASAAA